MLKYDFFTTLVFMWSLLNITSFCTLSKHWSIKNKLEDTRVKHRLKENQNVGYIVEL